MGGKSALANLPPYFRDWHFLTFGPTAIHYAQYQIGSSFRDVLIKSIPKSASMQIPNGQYDRKVVPDYLSVAKNSCGWSAHFGSG
jgi:hypothetical protein